MPCSFKAAASFVVYSNGTTRLRSLSKFWPSSAIQSLSTSNCICTACTLVKFAPIPRLLTRYLRAGPKKVAVSGRRATRLDDLGQQYLSSPLDNPALLCPTSTTHVRPVTTAAITYARCGMRPSENARSRNCLKNSFTSLNHVFLVAQSGNKGASRLVLAP